MLESVILIVVGSLVAEGLSWLREKVHNKSKMLDHVTTAIENLPPEVKEKAKEEITRTVVSGGEKLSKKFTTYIAKRFPNHV